MNQKHFHLQLLNQLLHLPLVLSSRYVHVDVQRFYLVLDPLLRLRQLRHPFPIPPPLRYRLYDVVEAGGAGEVGFLPDRLLTLKCEGIFEGDFGECVGVGLGGGDAVEDVFLSVDEAAGDELVVGGFAR